MTNIEVLREIVNVKVSDVQLTRWLMKYDLNPDDTWTAEIDETLEKITAYLLHDLITTPDVSEGGFSYKSNLSAIQERIKFLAEKYDLEDLASVKPGINNGTNKW